MWLVTVNSCDRCFGLIELERRRTGDLYVPDDWAQVIAAAKKSKPKFTVIKMDKENFFSCEDLQRMIVNRKISEDKSKVNWLYFATITHQRDEFFVLIVSTYDDKVQRINLKKKKHFFGRFCWCRFAAAL